MIYKALWLFRIFPERILKLLDICWTCPVKMAPFQGEKPGTAEPGPDRRGRGAVRNKKEETTMMKKILSLILVIMALTGVCVTAAQAGDGKTYWVYTENGKGLNVRSAPYVGDNQVATLDYRDVLRDVTLLGNGWASVKLNRFPDPVYVMSRYLTTQDPGPWKKAEPTPTPADDKTKTAAAAMNAINAEFRSAKQVTNPYMVVARPTRASGWVNLRWAPSTEAERIATCSQGKELIVLTEMTNWYQVQDPATGMIGFISRQYVSRH